MMMRRFLLALLVLLTAGAAWAATPYYLDRSGVLWNASSAPEGLVLVAEREGTEVLRSVVPFEIGLNGASDTEIQVAADEATGKVAVVWQRNWSEQASEIMLAVWNNGTWERIVHLSDDLGAHPRFPTVQLSASATTVADPTAEDPNRTVTLRDSFLHVAWWEGVDQQHGTYALLRLSADPSDTAALSVHNLDELVGVGLSCDTPPTQEMLEHPLFVDQPSHDRALLFFGSEQICLFQLIEVHFELEPGDGGFSAIGQARRHRPVFGVRKSFQVPTQLTLEGARVLVGTDLHPVTYRVNNGTIEYVVATDQGWSAKRTISVKRGLPMEQLIPLVENLAQ